MSLGELVQARKQPPYATAMPPTAECTCYASSIQLVGKTEIGSAARHKFANDWEQSNGAGVCGPLIAQRTMTSADARRPLPAYLLH